VEVFADKLGLAWPFALIAIAAEFLGGIGLLMGFMTRLSALAVGTYMAIAMFRNHWMYGFFMNWNGLKRGEGIEFHLLAVAMALALLGTGGGHLSLDHAIFGSGHRRR
jgi:putative oxidoreductase